MHIQRRREYAFKIKPLTNVGGFMDFLQELFANGAITWEQFTQAVTSKGYKIADLATGNYVDKKKFDDGISAKDTQIKELTEQISARDKDLSTLKKQLSDGSIDSQTKLTELTEKLTKLQGEYDTAKKDYEGRIAKQAYESAVKLYAIDKKFTSTAARRDFENQLLGANLKMENGVIQGVDTFEAEYRKNNADAFVVEKTDPEPAPQPQNQPLPTFVQPTAPGQPAPEVNPFLAAYGFNPNFN